jgi:hypothetical protein
LGKSLLMSAPSLHQREGLVAVRLRAEKRADFVEAVTKAHGGGEHSVRSGRLVVAVDWQCGQRILILLLEV